MILLSTLKLCCSGGRFGVLYWVIFAALQALNSEIHTCVCVKMPIFAGILIKTVI